MLVISQELLGNIAAAHHMYESGLQVLQYIANSPVLVSEDRLAVQKLMDAFARRLRVCNKTAEAEVAG